MNKNYNLFSSLFVNANKKEILKLLTKSKYFSNLLTTIITNVLLIHNYDTINTF